MPIIYNFPQISDAYLGGMPIFFQGPQVSNKRIGITKNYVRETNMMTKQVKMTGNYGNVLTRFQLLWANVARALACIGGRLLKRGCIC
jgi:hypothetical protein